MQIRVFLNNHHVYYQVVTNTHDDGEKNQLQKDKVVNSHKWKL